MEKRAALKVSPLVEEGMGFDHVGATRLRTETGMWIKPFDKHLEESSVYRSAVCTLLSLVQRRPDFQSTVLWLCRRLMKPNAQSDRQHRRLLRYLKGSKDLATFFQTASEDMVIKDCVDGDWGCDELDRKSVRRHRHGWRLPHSLPQQDHDVSRPLLW